MTTVTPLTPAMRWALEMIAKWPGCSMADLGGRMMDRPGFKHTPSRKHLSSAQGCGRLGARMTRLLEDRGLARSHYKRSTSATYRVAYLTPAGTKELHRK